MLVTTRGPFIVVATVIVGCLVLGVALVVFYEAVPALVVSVLLACSVATLLYGILGGVSDAGLDLGWVSMGGSAAVLLGSVLLFNRALDPQLERIRHERRVEQFGFDFDRHAAPSDGWFAIDESTGVPVEVAFTDPVTDEVVKTVQRPTVVSLPLKLAPTGNDRYLVLGTGAETGQGIGYVSASDLISAMGSLGWQPGTVYGFQRLHLAREGEFELPQGMVRRWGNTVCRGESMPFEIEVVRFSGFTDYDLRRCDTTEGSEPDYSSSLDNHSGELVELTIEGKRRSFLVGVVAANHRPNPPEPPWSTFFVIEIEMVSGRGLI